jgi:hypothetical protein
MANNPAGTKLGAASRRRKSNLTFGAALGGRSNIGGGIGETGSTAAPLGEYLRFEESTGNLVVVPEPSTYAMALAGLACGGWHMYRRRRLRQAPTLAA